MVVHSNDGLDEISAAASTHVVEARGDAIEEYELSPVDLGLEATSLDGLEVDGALESLDLIRSALSGAPGERAARARNMVALNAGAALYVAGLQASVKDGVTEASRLLRAGTPWARVEALADYTASV